MSGPNILGKPRGRTLAESLTMMARIPLPSSPSAPAAPGLASRAGAELGGFPLTPHRDQRRSAWVGDVGHVTTTFHITSKEA